jgi:hypothetical protein
MLSLSAEQPTLVEVAQDGIHWTVKTAAASGPTTKVNFYLIGSIFRFLYLCCSVMLFLTSYTHKAIYHQTHRRGNMTP